MEKQIEPRLFIIPLPQLRPQGQGCPVLGFKELLWLTYRQLVSRLVQWLLLNILCLIFTKKTEILGNQVLMYLLFLTLYHTIPAFDDTKKEAFLITLWKKKKMLVSSIFSFSNYVFYPFKDRNHYLSYIYFVFCKCSEFDDVQNFIVW